MKRILVTGAAGFVGYHVSHRLLSSGYEVLGLDNFNDYYSQVLKEKRVERLLEFKSFKLIRADLNDPSFEQAARLWKPEIIIHLAAQAGVRYSLENPGLYAESNLSGFLKILELARAVKPEHFIYASSSSVYGANDTVPFKTTDRTDQPVSLYAASKKANEVMAYSYSHLFGIPTTGLRFFTVYGSWGRPDMAYFQFTLKLLREEEISLFNQGKMRRDFTHVSDIVESIVRLLPKPPKPEAGPPVRLLNIGASSPVNLLDFVGLLSKITGKPAKCVFKPMQDGDVVQTYADVSDLELITEYSPKVGLEEGLHEFVQWLIPRKDWF